MRKILKKKKGFTLIEMLVVLIIIGLLISIAMPAAKGILERAKVTTAQANARNIWIAEQGKALDTAWSDGQTGDWGNVKLPEGQTYDVDPDTGVITIKDASGKPIATYPS